MAEDKKILITDDSDLIREITARIVKELDFGVLEAANAEESIEICREKKPVAVFLDWDLPSLGALDFLRAASELPAEDRPPIVLCATENDPQQFTLAKAAGAAHYILKPYDRDTIAAKLSELGLIEGDKSAQRTNVMQTL